jgi:hypothetical protein
MTKNERTNPTVERESAVPSPTAVAAEAMATGVVPLATHTARRPATAGIDERLTAGDPDERPENAAFVGDVAAAGDMPTPDQDQVDPIGRAMGVSEEDSGALRTSSELLDKRDRHRAFQEVPEDHSKD